MRGVDHHPSASPEQSARELSTLELEPTFLAALARYTCVLSFLEEALEKTSQYYIASVGAPGKPMVSGSCAVLAMLIRSAPRPGELGRANDLAVRACQLGVASFCEPGFKR